MKIIGGIKERQKREDILGSYFNNPGENDSGSVQSGCDSCGEKQLSLEIFWR